MFEQLNSLPPDPILGLMAACRADNNPDKIDLGVGIYKDEAGNTPVMASVKAAEARLLSNQESKAYVGPAGLGDFNEAIAKLVFGEQLTRQLGNRRVTFQTPGGCGGLRLAADLIQRARPGARILVSDPTWANHIPLLGGAGLQIETYPYYDRSNHSIRFDEMMTVLATAGPDDLVLLHGCCHNPCGADLTPDQWQAVAQLADKNGFTPFIDLAYQGLGDGLDADAYGLRLLAETVPEMIVVNSCSKNFSLYRERTGGLSIITASEQSSRAVISQTASITRGSYSMPPDHGASVVAEILLDPALKQQWELELTEVRHRINNLRSQLVTALNSRQSIQDFSFIEREKGMFSFLGLSVDQVQTLITDYSVYLVDSSRINVAGINNNNIDYMADAVARVIA